MANRPNLKAQRPTAPAASAPAGAAKARTANTAPKSNVVKAPVSNKRGIAALTETTAGTVAVRVFAFNYDTKNAARYDELAENGAVADRNSPTTLIGPLYIRKDIVGGEFPQSITVQVMW
jgi:hypothetical protein